MKSPTINQHAVLMLIYAMSPSGRIKKDEFMSFVEKILDSLAPDMAFVNANAIVAITGAVNGIMRVYPVSEDCFDMWHEMHVYPIKKLRDDLAIRLDVKDRTLTADYYSVYLKHEHSNDVLIADVATLDQANDFIRLIEKVSYLKDM